MGWVTGRHPVRVIVNTGQNLSARLLAATKFLVPVLPGGYVPVSASACGARRGRGAAADGRGRRARSGQERHPPVLAARPPRVGDAYWQGMPASRRPPCVTSGAHSGRLVTLSHRHTVRYVISSLDAASRVRAAVRFPSPGSWRSRSTAASRRSASARGTRHPRTARDTVEHSADALHHLRSGRALHGAQRRWRPSTWAPSGTRQVTCGTYHPGGWFTVARRPLACWGSGAGCAPGRGPRRPV